MTVLCVVKIKDPASAVGSTLAGTSHRHARVGLFLALGVVGHVEVAIDLVVLINIVDDIIRDPERRNSQQGCKGVLTNATHR